MVVYSVMAQLKRAEVTDDGSVVIEGTRFAPSVPWWS
jgi:hypothetical protein